MKVKLIIGFMILAGGAQSLKGEVGGSAYSALGIGDLRYSTGTRGAAMGYTGIGLASPGFINGLSPATWARINRTRLEIGLLYEGFKSTDGNRSLFLSNADFDGALLALPISNDHGITFVGGFTPFSDFNYNIFSHNTQSGIEYTVNRVGTGGLGKAMAGLSYAPNQLLSFGASFNYLFGSRDDERRFLPTTSGTFGGTISENQTVNGVTVTVGGLYSSFSGISESLRPLSIGCAVTSRGILKTEQQTYYTFTNEVDTSSTTRGKLALPLTYAFGISYQIGERWTLAADYYAQQWSKAEFNGITPPDVRNSFRTGVGGERMATRDQSAPWLDRLTYRFGAYYNSTYYRVNGQPINEWGITGGLAVPFSGDTRLNIALEYAQRGTTRAALIKDTIFRVSVSLNLSELWFIPFEEEL
jgi:hypothetical protein